MIRAHPIRSALAMRLARKARRLAEAQAEAQAEARLHTRRRDPQRWRKPRLLWPLFTEE